MRRLATIQKIADVQPIEDADAIEKVKVKEWWCVAKKNEFKVDDLCVYFEIDSLLPANNGSFSFLEKGTKKKKMNIDGKEYEGYRLKTIKLRGQISQGLALPLKSVISNNDRKEGTIGFEIGEDVSEALDIVKYEVPIPAQLMGKMKGTRPGFIPKTDEERIQNLGHLIEKYQGGVFYITEKLDGSSSTFFKKDGEFRVCSRNIELIDTPENSFWNIARKYNLADKMPEGFAIQGETVGEGIQANPLKLSGIDFYAYNVFNLTTNQYPHFEEFQKFCAELGIKTVPVLDEKFVLRGSVEDILKLAEGNSIISSQVLREGIVIRPLIEGYETIGGTLQRFSFKAISNSYLLKVEI